MALSKIRVQLPFEQFYEFLDFEPPFREAPTRHDSVGVFQLGGTRAMGAFRV